MADIKPAGAEDTAPPLLSPNGPAPITDANDPALKKADDAPKPAGEAPKPFGNPGRRKGAKAPVVPDAVRVLKDVIVSTQSGTIAFTRHQIVEDKYLIAVLVNSDAKFEPIDSN